MRIRGDDPVLQALQGFLALLESWDLIGQLPPSSRITAVEVCYFIQNNAGDILRIRISQVRPFSSIMDYLSNTEAASHSRLLIDI